MSVSLSVQWLISLRFFDFNKEDFLPPLIFLFMYTIPELQLNKFRVVRIPSNKEYFFKLGFTSVSPENFSGEEKCLPAFSSKLDSVRQSLEDYDNYCELMAHEDSNK